MKYGYAHISTNEHNAAMQLAALKEAGCMIVFTHDGISSATTKRSALLRCLETLEEGDTLIVWKLDRLARSLSELIHMLDKLRERGVRFQSLIEAIDTETTTGDAIWQLIGMLADMERSLVAERTRAGVKAAQSRGVRFGRKPKLTAPQLAHVRKLIEQGEAVPEVAKLLSVDRATIYRALQRAP